jgi:hypothetical protein
MRGVLIIAALAGVAGCSAPPPAPVVFADSGWRTAAGQRLSLGEVAALRQLCRPEPVAARFTDGPAPEPLRDNPVYRPGGEGLANAPPTGLAAPDTRFVPVLAEFPGSASGAGSLEDCLYGKGLGKIR